MNTHKKNDLNKKYGVNLSKDSTPVINNELKIKFLEYIERIMKNKSFDLTEIYPESDEITVLLKQVDDLKRCLDSFRPLNPIQVKNIRESEDIEYTYESNRIEGNTLTLSETEMVINKGITIGGKPLDDHLEAIGHNEAIDFIRDMATKNKPIDEYDLKSIHNIILRKIQPKYAGVYRNMEVTITGSSHKPPQPYIVSKLMEDYFIWYNDNREKTNPVLLSAQMHQKLVNIHPFVDGNGRTSRLVMNLILLQNGFPIANISGEGEKRKEYYQSLENHHLTNNSDVFYKFIANRVKESLMKYLSIVSVNIDEDNKGGYFYQKVDSFLKKKNI